MRHFLITFTTLLAIAIAATACGDDPEDTVSEITVPDDTVSEITVPEITVSDDTVPDGDQESLGAGPYPIADLTVTTFTDGSDAATGTVYRLACLGDTATLTGDRVMLSADSMCLTLNDDSARTQTRQDAVRPRQHVLDLRRARLTHRMITSEHAATSPPVGTVRAPSSMRSSTG